MEYKLWLGVSILKYINSYFLNSEIKDKVGKPSETDSIKSQISCKTSREKKEQHKKTPSKTSSATTR